MQQRIQTIETLLNSAIKQTSDQSGREAKAHFIIIDEENRVNSCRLISQTISSNILWTIACVESIWTDYGKSHNYEVFAILDKTGNILTKISFTNWTLETIRFKSHDTAHTPRPVAIFYLNNSPNERLVFEPSRDKSFQKVWDFFQELDKNCKTLNEGKIYKEFFNLRSDNDVAFRTLKEFRLEKEKQDNLLHQYRDLLQEIKELIANK